MVFRLLILISMVYSCAGPHLFLSNKTRIFNIDHTNQIDFELVDRVVMDVCQELDTCQYNELLTITWGYNSPCYNSECYHCGNNAIYIEPVSQHNEYYLSHALGHFYSEKMGFTCDDSHLKWEFYNIKSW